MKSIHAIPLSVCLLAASAAVVSAETESPAVLGSFHDIQLTDRDLTQEITDVRTSKKIEIDPDRKTLFTLVENMMVRRILAEEAAQQHLIPEDLLEAKLRRQREIWLSQARLDSLAKEMTPEELDAAAHEMYVAHKENYMTDETVDSAHILLRLRGKGRSEEATKQLADELYAKLKADPGLFEEVAREHSEDPKTAQKGGQLGAMATKRLVQPFKEAAMALKPGEISAPVQTQFGYHIIRLNAYTPSEQLPFDKVKGALIAQSQKQARQTAITTYLDKVKTSPDFHYDEAAVQKYFDENFYHEGKAKAPAK